MTPSPRFRVRIERLVIDGVPGLRASDLVSALTAELEQLAAAGTRDASSGAPPELDVDLVADPEAGGQAIAAAIYARLAATGYAPAETARFPAAREALGQAPTELARLPEVTRG